MDEQEMTAVEETAAEAVAAEEIPTEEPTVETAESPAEEIPAEETAEPPAEEACAESEEAPVEEAPAEEHTEPDPTAETLAEINGKLDTLSELFTKKIQHTAHEEQIVDQMHAELQRYKEDMYSQLVRPILLDIIEIRDSILRMGDAYAKKPEGEQNIPLKMFTDYSYDVQEILEKNNITIYSGEEGDAFNPVKQRALKKVKTPVEELHGKVAESLSSGYEYLGKPISPEKVAVFVYEKPDETEGEE